LLREEATIEFSWGGKEAVMQALRSRKEYLMWALALGITAFVYQPVVAAQNSSTPEAWKKVEEAMGRSGQMQPGDVIKFGMPRGDLHVMVSGVAIKPALALGSWAAFKDTVAGEAMVMGDLVLTEDEIESVMKKLADSGIQITAAHNHLIGESPRIMYMHIASHGDALKMAQAIRVALELTKTPAPAPPAAQASELAGIDQKRIEATLGYSGKVTGGVLQVSAPRAETITDGAMVVPPSMGVATAINFQPTGAGKAAITGDFVLVGKEVNPVLKALRDHGIEVTAIHSHMLEEAPRLFFMHFWANDDAVKLAQGLRVALDATNSKKP
jgi:biotin operon repressor